MIWVRLIDVLPNSSEWSKNRMSNIKLKYIGHGEYIVGIPARDLTDSDIVNISDKSQYSIDETEKLLIASGLYKSNEAISNKRKRKSGSKVEEEDSNDNSTESI